MGQYHKVYNLDKQEFIHPHRIDNGLGGGGNGRERVGLQGTAIAEVEIVVHR